MSGIREVKRLVRQYDRAFKDGRQRLFEEKDRHIGVLQIAVATLEQRQDELSNEMGLWGEAIAYGYDARMAMSKWMIIHRLIMFLLEKHAERKFQKTLDEFDCICECKKKLEGFLNQLIVVCAW